MTDEDLMRRAIALAAGQVGRTGDNPAVGCVIARDGQVIAEGATGDGGRPHAEEAALAAAGAAARGATAYVTLEPCAERSSGAASCSARLAAAGVARVVAACADASVFAAGRGAETLHAHGVQFDRGLLNQEAALLYSGYLPAKYLESGR
jgi:diaminohydroxyphosphoribosylaminopyrimidine deaminase/5-amino-6-(5-phosphoribosylamino)uracil reductase